MKSFPLYIIIVIMASLFSCGEKIEEFDGYGKSEAIRLLVSTGYPDSAKVWRLTEYQVNGESQLTDCLDSMRVQFVQISIDSLEIEGNYVFYLNDPSNCSPSRLCVDVPETCELNENFCEDHIEFCDVFGPNIIFAGSWRIPDPEFENEKVNTLIINGPNGEVNYDLRYFTSQILDITGSIQENNQNIEIRKGFKYNN